MSDMPFGNLFKNLSNLDNKFKEIDAKLEKFQKATETYVNKAEKASQNISKSADRNFQKFDKITKTLSDKLDSEKTE